MPRTQHYFTCTVYYTPVRGGLRADLVLFGSETYPITSLFPEGTDFSGQVFTDHGAIQAAVKVMIGVLEVEAAKIGMTFLQRGQLAIAKKAAKPS